MKTFGFLNSWRTYNMNTIKVFHVRPVRTDNNQIATKGGKTIAIEVDENDTVLAYAEAKCHIKDNFCKRTGRVKAEGRLKSPRFRHEITEFVPFKQFLPTIFNHI